MRYVIAVAVALALSLGTAWAPAAFAAGDEQKVSLDQVPAAVKAALEKEAKGGTIGEVSKEMHKGKAVYEAEITKDGKQRFVEVREDGKVMKRESAKKEMKEDAKEAKKANKY
jgi:hypothetical protein